MSALILPQHASDRQMIEKEPRKRRRGGGGGASHVCAGVCFEDGTRAEVRKRMVGILLTTY